MSDAEPEICRHCKKPILPGQPIHGGLHVHWACHQEFGFEGFLRKLRDSLARVEEVAKDLDKKLRE